MLLRALPGGPLPGASVSVAGAPGVPLDPVSGALLGSGAGFGVGLSASVACAFVGGPVPISGRVGSGDVSSVLGITGSGGSPTRIFLLEAMNI